MNVLLVAFELAPYVSPSPAGEAVANLSKALRLLGLEVTVCLPKTPEFEQSGLLAARRLSPLRIDDSTSATVYDSQLASGVTLTLIESDSNKPPSAESARTDATLVGHFAKAVAALVAQQASTEAPFDVVHANDALAALCLLNLDEHGSTGHPAVGRILTIHDAARSGEFPGSAAAALGIPDQRKGVQGFGVGEGLCLLKGLVVEADAILTPSETYGRQIKAPEKYGALSRAFQAVQIHGIGEGVDHAVFNPATDAALVSRYDAPDPSNKGRNKLAVLDELELEYDIARPVIFCEDADSGDVAMDTLMGALPALIRNDVTLVICGSAAQRESSRRVLEPFSNQVKWVSDLAPPARRRILAAADFYLSLRRRDPSGQGLMQAARYGAIPIAYRVDAVTDVVVDADAELKTGTGIVFEAVTQRALVSAVARAIAAYHSSSFPSLLRRVMRQDLGWERSARRHLQVYRGAISAHGGAA